MRGPATVVLSLALIVLGIAIIVRTLVAGVDGVAVGLIFGVLFVAAGVGRLYVERHR